MVTRELLVGVMSSIGYETFIGWCTNYGLFADYVAMNNLQHGDILSSIMLILASNPHNIGLCDGQIV